MEEAERDEIVRYCDNQELAGVYAIAPLLGPTCTKNSSPLAAELFQLGASLGGDTGVALVRTQATVDALGEFPVDRESRVDMLDLARKQFEFAQNEEKIGVRKAIEPLAGHECLVAAVALRITRRGLACGGTAVDSAKFRDAYREVYMRVCSPFSTKDDCALRADAGFARRAGEMHETIARTMQRLGE